MRRKRKKFKVRLREKVKQKRIRRISRVFSVFLCLFAIFFILKAFSTTFDLERLLKIDKICLIGSTELDIHGLPIKSGDFILKPFFVNFEGIKQKYSYIKEIKIKLSPPTVYLNVIEKKPIAAIVGRGTEKLIDEEGDLFTKKINPHSLPKIKNYEKSDFEFIKKICTAFNPSLIEKDRYDFFLLTMRDGTIVFWGRDEFFSLKSSALKKLTSQKYEYIKLNLINDGRIVVKPLISP